VTVAFFSLLLLLGLGAITRREAETQRRAFSTLGVVLVGLVIVMLVSAFQRLVLYEAAYGFSRLRTYTHVFMIWLALLLIVVVILEMTRRERMAGLAMVIASLGFAVSLSLLNVDAFIVKQNVESELHGVADETLSNGRVDLDTQYFLDLSDDAVPALADAFQNMELPVAVREKVGAALFCKRREREQDERKVPWQSFHVARFTADKIFTDLKEELSAYTLKDVDYPVTVETPSGEEFSCYPYYYD
jgi:fumarate reductase subunit C